MWSGRSGEPVRHLGAEAVIGRWLVHLTGLVFPVDVAARRRTVLVRMDGTARRRWARRSKVLCELGIYRRLVQPMLVWVSTRGPDATGEVPPPMSRFLLISNASLITAW